MLLVKKYNSVRQLHIMVTAGMIFFLITKSVAQFAPPAGQPGSTAISTDSSIFVQWASACLVARGYMDISDTSLGYANYGMDTAAVGIADFNVVSLGDGGSAVLYFDTPLVNGSGFDFAVFENSFSDEFLELAFVEVSSDGSRFFRFGSTSNTQTEEQVDTFGTLDATKLHNLAGKYRGGYGTPFDLEELKDSVGLDISNIIAVRIVDVVGSVDPEYGSYDGQGNIINDPWPTPFESSGFDLDAVGVIHDKNHTDVYEKTYGNLIVAAPNPVTDVLKITGIEPGGEFVIYDLTGHAVYSSGAVQHRETSISVSEFPKGVLFIRILNGNNVRTLKIIHL